MKKSILTAMGAALVAAVALSAPASAGQCVNKGGRGTGSSLGDARFQAWEAVLQATDWGMWSVWITTSGKVGQAASGYKVSNVRERCGNGGALGKECIIHARLCN